MKSRRTPGTDNLSTTDLHQKAIMSSCERFANHLYRVIGEARQWRFAYCLLVNTLDQNQCCCGFSGNFEVPECVLSSAEMHSLCMLPCSISVIVMNRPLHREYEYEAFLIASMKIGEIRQNFPPSIGVAF